MSASYHVASPDFEAKEYDLGTTSVRLVRVGTIIQLIYSNKLDARILYAELSSRFKNIQDEFKSGPS
jgi:hypothetical protein